jgi:hypothetical protein
MISRCEDEDEVKMSKMKMNVFPVTLDLQYCIKKASQHDYL